MYEILSLNKEIIIIILKLFLFYKSLLLIDYLF